MDPHRLDVDIPDPVENRKSTSGRAVRLIYLFGLMVFLGFIIWHFLRFMVFLEGSGTISAKKFVISAPYQMHVETINVIAGSRVKRGDIIATANSFEVDQYRSDLLRSLADLTTREAEFQIRLSIARASLEPTSKRVEIAKEITEKFLTWSHASANLQYRTEIFRELSNAVEASAHAGAESKEISIQLTRIADSKAKLEERLAKIDDEFNDGKILAPIDGVVAFDIAKEGQTILVGDPIGGIYDTNAIYIDWEIPLRRFLEPKVGDTVFITSGYSMIEGTISDIYPISTTLGADRRDFFSSTTQGQTARVKNHGFDQFLPIDSQVVVRMNYTIALDRLFGLFRPTFRK